MTRIFKNIRNNWEAEDRINLVANRVLIVCTTKRSDGTLVTSATVHLRDGNFLSHRMFQDFSQRMMTAQTRCTEKSVTAQHAMCMTKINELHSAITAHYAREEVAA